MGVGLGVALTLGGCTDYLSRRDTMTLESGEAVQTNVAIHTADPWPRSSRIFNRNTDGERLQHGIERYRNPQSAAGTFGAPAVAPGGGAVAPTGSLINR